MSANAVLNRWGVPLGVVLAGAGLVMVWVSLASGDAQGAKSLLIAAAGAFVLSGAAFVWEAVLRRRSRAINQELKAYGCPRCGYAAKYADLKNERPFPCPTCGEPVYDDK